MGADAMKMGVFYVPDGGRPPILDALVRIGAERKNQEAALKLIRIRRNVERAAKDFQEARNALIKQHGEGDDASGYRVLPKSPNLAAFVADMNELCAQAVPAEMLGETIAIADLWRRENGERVEIPIAENDIDALGDLLVLDEASVK